MRDDAQWGFPGGAVVKDLPANRRDAEDLGSITELGRCPGVGNGNSLQYSCLENSVDRGVWRATVHGVAKSQTLLSTNAYMLLSMFVRHFFQPCKRTDTIPVLLIRRLNFKKSQ